jgi:hypothetical protein
MIYKYLITLIIGIIIGCVLTFIFLKYYNKKETSTNNIEKTIIGKWQMPDDLAILEPLKSNIIQINNNDYTLTQGSNTILLKLDDKKYYPITNIPTNNIDYYYDDKQDKLIQEISGHPFIYTRIN